MLELLSVDSSLQVSESLCRGVVAGRVCTDDIHSAVGAGQEINFQFYLLCTLNVL